MNGFDLDGITHYTAVDDFAGGSFASDYYSIIGDLPIISVVTFESNGNNVHIAYAGNTVTLKITSNYDFESFDTLPIINVSLNGKQLTANSDPVITGKEEQISYTLGYNAEAEGQKIEFSIGSYEFNGRNGETITKPTFSSGVVFYNGEITTVKQAKEYGGIISEDDNIPLKDDYDNVLLLPAGFRVTQDATTAVTGGVVIEDKNENEFVWVPIGTIHTGSGDKTTGTTRSEIANGGYNGFYIGRYEARKNANDELTEKASDEVYNNVTYSEASTMADNMAYKFNFYPSHYYEVTFRSGLIDTDMLDCIIKFVEAFSGNSNYGNQTSVNTTFAKYGTNSQTTKDVVCNIYDMASNCAEWLEPVETFGGCYMSNTDTTTTITPNYGSDDTISFRPILGYYGEDI